jgi:hypothetical protein
MFRQALQRKTVGTHPVFHSSSPRFSGSPTMATATSSSCDTVYSIRVVFAIYHDQRQKPVFGIARGQNRSQPSSVTRVGVTASAATTDHNDGIARNENSGPLGKAQSSFPRFVDNRSLETFFKEKRVCFILHRSSRRSRHPPTQHQEQDCLCTRNDSTRFSDRNRAIIGKGPTS